MKLPEVIVHDGWESADSHVSHITLCNYEECFSEFLAGCLVLHGGSFLTNKHTLGLFAVFLGHPVILYMHNIYAPVGEH